MITSIPNLSIYSTESKSATNPSWKLGDIMPGKVVSTGKGSSIVSISGSNYWLNSSLPFTQGESLMLKVAGLTPMAHFSLVNRIQRNVGNSEVVTMSSQDKILQNLATSDRNINSSITSLISLLHFGSSQALPPATLQLIDSMRRRLMKSGGLTNPSLIRHSVLNGSVVSTGAAATSGAAAPDTGLQSLLHQIVDSLAMHRGAAGRSPALGNYQNAIGLAQYQSDDGDLLRSFTRSAEEQYLNLTNSKSRPQEETQLQPYRLFVELPVVFKDHISSISIRFTDGKHCTKKDSDQSPCSTEFEFELRNCGSVFTRINIFSTSVSYFIGCESERVATHLAQREQELAESLDAYGLKLDTFKSQLSTGHLSPDPVEGLRLQDSVSKQSVASSELADAASTDESLRQRLREAYDQGRMPALGEFKLEINSQTVALETEIPVELYCAMAAFFVQLLELENT